MTNAAISTAQEGDASELRFGFGRNWKDFLALYTEERIQTATESLQHRLSTKSLVDRTFLDIGSGSGLFSLAARRLGASVFSFDFDPDSVACAKKLKEQFFPNDPNWTVRQGSVLDEAFIGALGSFDIVYSWGVLHHTGSMWKAIDKAASLVKPGGCFFISIYNNQGRASRMWTAAKRAYNSLPKPLRFLVLFPCLIRLWGPRTVIDLMRGKPFETWRNYSTNRGMSAWHDVVDWVGGYPFEVAKPEEIFAFCKARGFNLEQFQTCAGGHGCNEFVFTRNADRA